MRLAIINHSTHTLYVEDVPENILDQYGGEEEAYINDNYDFADSVCSWDYIVDTQYIDKAGDPHDVNFEELCD